MDNFIIYAIIAAIGISCITGLLGCFVVWKRMAYFGDSLAHSALLGIAIGYLFSININIGILFIAIIFSILLTYLQHKYILSTDTILGILAHGGIAIGMVMLSLSNYPNFDLHQFLFGDILTISLSEIYYIYFSLICIYAIMYFCFDKLLLMTISKDIAQSQGINSFKYQLIFISLMAVTVTVSVKIIGVLLITSMLIIPAAASRNIAESPILMCIFAILIGILSVIGGISFAYHFNTPSGPSIVMISIIIFILLFSYKLIKAK